MIAAMHAVRTKGEENGFCWRYFYAHTAEEALEIAKHIMPDGGEVADLTARRREWIAF